VAGAAGTGTEEASEVSDKPVKLSRRGFMRVLGVGMAAAVVLSKLPPHLPEKGTAPRPKPKVVRRVVLPDGTVVGMSDWGDYPMWSRATYTVDA